MKPVQKKISGPLGDVLAANFAATMTQEETQDVCPRIEAGFQENLSIDEVAAALEVAPLYLAWFCRIHGVALPAEPELQVPGQAMDLFDLATALLTLRLEWGEDLPVVIGEFFAGGETIDQVAEILGTDPFVVRILCWEFHILTQPGGVTTKRIAKAHSETTSDTAATIDGPHELSTTGLTGNDIICYHRSSADWGRGGATRAF